LGKGAIEKKAFQSILEGEFPEMTSGEVFWVLDLADSIAGMDSKNPLKPTRLISYNLFLIQFEKYMLKSYITYV